MLIAQFALTRRFVQQGQDRCSREDTAARRIRLPFSMKTGHGDILSRFTLLDIAGFDAPVRGIADSLAPPYVLPSILYNNIIY